MHIKSLTINAESYPRRDVYPFNLSLFQKTKKLDFNTPVTIFIGENGCGKSTLLEAIARRCSIHIWEPDKRERYKANPFETLLFHFLDVEWSDGIVPGAFFGSDRFTGFARLVDEWAATDPGLLEYYGGESLLRQSQGQRTLNYFGSRFKRKGLYLLDEPENALSPKRQVELKNIITESYQNGGKTQFIIATHSPILMAEPSAQLYNFDTVPITEIEYKDTDHFRVYKDFLNSV